MAKELTDFERALLNKSANSLTAVEAAHGALRGFVRVNPDMSGIDFTDKAASFLRRDGKSDTHASSVKTPKEKKEAGGQPRANRKTGVVNVAVDLAGTRQRVIDAICTGWNAGDEFQRTQLHVEGLSDEEIVEIIRGLRSDGHLSFTPSATPGQRPMWRVMDTLPALRSKPVEDNSENVSGAPSANGDASDADLDVSLCSLDMGA